MRKAITTGIMTGIILTIILILGTLCRILFPANTMGANLTFILIFVFAIIMVLWVALKKFNRSTSTNWTQLNAVAVITSVTTALLFGAASFIYTKYVPAGYLSDLMEQSKQKLLGSNYSAQSISPQVELAWYQAPLNFAFNNLQVMLVVLFVLSIITAYVYYSRNRESISQHESHNNQELIF